MLLLAATGAQPQGYPFPRDGDQQQSILPPIDTTYAKEMEVKFRLQLGETSRTSYVEGMCGIENRNYLTFSKNGTNCSWSTFPTLDTTTSIPWRQITGLMPFDYDGVPPKEYVNVIGYVFQCNGDGLPIDRIDTMGCIDFRFDTWLIDADGDGIEDIVSIWSQDSAWMRITFGGGVDDNGGCDRTLVVPNPRREFYEHPYNLTTTMRPYRTPQGTLRFAVVGQHLFETRGIYLVDLTVRKTETGYTASHAIIDELVYDVSYFDPGEVRVVTGLAAVTDDIRGKQCVVVRWDYGWHPAGECLAVYDISQGKLAEREVTSTFANSASSLDTKLDDGDPVIGYNLPNGFRYYSRITALNRPFAKHAHILNSGRGVFINDQYGDGTRDLFATAEIPMQTNPEVVLINFDLRTTSAATTSSQPVTWAVLNGDALTVTMPGPDHISIDVTNTAGQTSRLLGADVHEGVSTYRLPDMLKGMSSGAYFLRVTRGDGSVAVFPYLQ